MGSKKGERGAGEEKGGREEQRAESLPCAFDGGSGAGRLIRGRRAPLTSQESMSNDDATDLAGSDESADLAAARDLPQRLMASGLERPEGDACEICFLLIELSMNKHAKRNVCCMKRVCKGWHFGGKAARHE